MLKKSDHAQAIKSKAVKEGARETSSATSSPFDVDGRIGPYDPVAAERSHAGRSANDIAGRLMYFGHMDDAFLSISRAKNARFDIASMIRTMYIYCALATSRFEEAYRELVLIEKPNDREVLQLCLASAGLGEVYPGQAAYAEELLERAFKAEHEGGSRRYVRTIFGQDARSVRLTSLLALGILAPHPPLFLELAMALDPSNLLAAEETMMWHIHRGQYSKARPIGAFLLEKTEGSERDRIFYSLDDVKGLADKPLPPPPPIPGPFKPRG